MSTPEAARIEATREVPDRCIPATMTGDRCGIIAVIFAGFKRLG